MNYCPIACCGRGVMDRQITCDRHWTLVPVELKNAIRKAKASRGTDAWKQLIEKAVTHVVGLEMDKREMERYVASHR